MVKPKPSLTTDIIDGQHYYHIPSTFGLELSVFNKKKNKWTKVPVKLALFVETYRKTDTKIRLDGWTPESF